MLCNDDRAFIRFVMSLPCVLLLLLELELAEIHDLAHGRLLEGGHLDKIQQRFAGHFQGLRGWHDADLLSGGTDQPDLADANLLVDPLMILSVGGVMKSISWRRQGLSTPQSRMGCPAALHCVAGTSLKWRRGRPPQRNFRFLQMPQSSSTASCAECARKARREQATAGTGQTIRRPVTHSAQGLRVGQAGRAVGKMKKSLKLPVAPIY
jgi:hypothetical protein